MQKSYCRTVSIAKIINFFLNLGVVLVLVFIIVHKNLYANDNLNFNDGEKNKFKNIEIINLNKLKNFSNNLLIKSSKHTNYKRPLIKTNGIGTSLNLNEEVIYQIIFNQLKNWRNPLSKTGNNLNNKNDEWGVFSNGGFSYVKKFKYINMYLTRFVSQDFFEDDRYIIKDNLIIEIKGEKLIKNLLKKNLIRIEESQVKAFLDLNFRRKYQLVHFSEDYNIAMNKDIDKIHILYKLFNQDHLMNLKENEIWSKEDFIGMGMGFSMYLSAHPQTSFFLDSSISYQNTNYVSIGKKESKTKLSFEKNCIYKMGINAGVIADFYKILEITLFEYSLKYKKENSYAFRLEIDEDTIRNEENYKFKKEIGKIFSYKKPSLSFISKYKSSEIEKTSVDVEEKYRFFLNSYLKKKKTEEITARSNGRLKKFFRHFYFTSMKKNGENLVKFKNSIVNYFFKNKNKTKKFLYNKSLEIEYEGHSDFIKNKDKIKLGKKDDEKILLLFNHNLHVNKFTGEQGKLNLLKTLKILNDYSSVDYFIIKKIESNILTAPIEIKFQTVLRQNSLLYLNAMEFGDVYGVIDEVCNMRNKKKWELLYRRYNKCKNSLKTSFDLYMKDLYFREYRGNEYRICKRLLDKKAKKIKIKNRGKILKHCLAIRNEIKNNNLDNIPLWSIKDFLENVLIYGVNKNNFYKIFGMKNVSIRGSLRSERADKEGQFINYFREGNRKNLNLVDTFITNSEEEKEEELPERNIANSLL